MKNKNIYEELQDISPLLTQMKGEKEGYKVPHLYFEKLQDKVLTKVAEKPQTMSIFARLFRPRIAAVFASLLLVSLVGVLVFNRVENTKIATLEDVSTEALALYVNENADDLDLDILLENDMPDLDFGDNIYIEQEALEYYIENDL